MDDLVFGLLWLAIPVLVLVFPIFVLSRLAQLKKEVDFLKSKIDYYDRELTRRSIGEQASPTSAPTVSPGFTPMQRPIPTEVPNVPPLQTAATPTLYQAPAHVLGPPTAANTSFQPSPFQASASRQATQSTQTPSAQEKKAADVESLLGSNWLAKLGIAAIAIAAAFFLQYAFRENWIGPRGQVGIGLSGAAVMLAIGQYLLRKERYNTYAQSLSSGGIIVYFLSIYAACNFYHPQVIAISQGLAAFAIGAIGASALAIYNKTEVPATICILGAFAAPVLIRNADSGVSQSMRPLYEYLVFLNIWVACLCRIRPWYSLSTIAFACTWLIYFQVTPSNSGWSSELFAILFLLSSFYAGGRVLATSPQQKQEDQPATMPAQMQVGLAMILGGCVAFAITSMSVLSPYRLLAISDVALAGILLSVLLAIFAAFIPGTGPFDRQIRIGLGYLSASALLAMIATALNTTPVVPVSGALTAFLFSLITFLMFSAAALAQHRDQTMEAPATALAAANLIIHAFSAHAALYSVRLAGAPAFSLWLPVAGCLSLVAAWIATRQRSMSRLLPRVLASGAVLLPMFGMLSLNPGASVASAIDYWRTDSLAALTAGFLLLSACWLAMRSRMLWAGARTNAVAAIGNSAWFAGSLLLALGDRRLHDISVLAGFALALAAYHAIVGIYVLRSNSKINRLIYLGIAVAYFTAAVPLQLHSGFITVVWSVEAAALIWTGSVQSDRRIRNYGLVLLMLSVVRAVGVDLLVSPVPTVLFLNTRTMAGLAVTIAAYLSARVMVKADASLAEDEQIVPGLLALAANTTTLLFISLDLWDDSGRRWGSVGGASAQQLSLSLFWALYGLGGVCVGIWKQIRPVRLFAVGLLLFSLVKVALYDLSSLDTPYRIVSFFALGVVLLIVSLLYTRFEERLKTEQKTVSEDSI